MAFVRFFSDFGSMVSYVSTNQIVLSTAIHIFHMDSFLNSLNNSSSVSIGFKGARRT